MSRFPLHPALAALLLASVVPAAADPPRLEPIRDPAAIWKRIPPEPVVEGSRTPAGAAAPEGAMTRFSRRWNPHPRVLVLLVDFQDRPADTAGYPPAHFQDLLFSENVMEHGSLREYFREVSNGRMLFSGRTVGWLRMPRTYAAYAGTQSGLCNCYPNSRTLAGDAVDAAVAAGVDFREFDDDGPDGLPGSGDDDGIVDAMVLVFAGQGAERTGLSTDIRSHYRDLSPRTVDGITIPDFVAIPEEENVGVAVHEMGHQLGSEDLYDRSLQGAGLGDYSVMAYNYWFGNALEPGGPDPYTRIVWGLAEPDTLVLDEPAYPVPDVHGNPKIPLLWTRGEPGSEYFLVENRRPTGADHYLAGDGLLVYHVDLSQRTQDDPAHYRVAVVQADGLLSLEGIDQPSLGDAGDYFPGREDVRSLDDGTTPSTRSNTGERTQVLVHDIGDPGPVITAWLGVGRYIASGPVPELEVEPESGFFPGDVDPATERIRIVIRNRGTRMGEGRLEVFSQDPRLQVESGVEVPVLGLGALDTRVVPDLVAVHLAGGHRASREVIPVEARWTAGGASYGMIAPLPLPGTRVFSEGFETDTSGVRSMPVGFGGNPWRRQSRWRAEGDWAWGTPGYGPDQDGVLELPPFLLPEGGVSELRFRNLLSTEGNNTVGYDGGYLEISTDGGNVWSPLEPRMGYPGDLLGGWGPQGWWGSTGGWEEVVVPLRVSGEVRVRFHFVSDVTGSEGIYTGWFVDAVVVRSWASDRAGVVSPVPATSGLHLDLSVLPVFPYRPIEGGVTLIREAGLLRRELGTWPYTGRLDARAEVGDPVPGAVERYWLRWDDPSHAPAGPFLVQVPGGAPGFFARTPGVIHRGDGGRIGYNVPGTEPLPVRLDLFDVQGRLLMHLVDAVQSPGFQEAVWPARAATGQDVAAGVYFLRARAGDLSEVHRLVVLP